MFDAFDDIWPNGERMFGIGSTDFSPGHEGWFPQSLKQSLITPIAIHNGVIQWSVAAPVADGTAVVVGDLRLNRLSDVLTDFQQATSLEVHVVNADHKIVYSTDWGTITDDAGLIKKGMLALTENNQAVAHSRAGKPDAARTNYSRGTDRVA